jgi:hypothetical protein
MQTLIYFVFNYYIGRGLFRQQFSLNRSLRLQTQSDLLHHLNQSYNGYSFYRITVHP